MNNEHLAETTVETLEITINFPQSGMTLLEHIQVYKDLWQELKAEFKPIKDLYFIEYCKTDKLIYTGIYKLMCMLTLILYVNLMIHYY